MSAIGNTDACKHCYLLIAHRAIGIGHVYSVGVLTVSCELLYLGDGNESEIGFKILTINHDENSIVSELRSFKNELSVSPGSFIDISIETVSKKEQSFFTENEIILKKLGRIKNLYNKDLDKPTATLMVSGDLFKVYFDEDVDLELIKKNLTTRQNKYQEEMNKISQRLANKGFVDRAPKDIVDQEKTNYNNLKNDVERISITIKGL